MLEPRSRLQLAPKFGRISHGLGQCYPHFDAISPGQGAVLFRKLVLLEDQRFTSAGKSPGRYCSDATQQRFRPRNV